MKILLICLVLVVGCASQETRQLAQGIHRFQVKQVGVVRMLAEFARSKELISQKKFIKILEDQEALSVSSRSLSEIVGEPKIPVEVDSW